MPETMISETRETPRESPTKETIEAKPAPPSRSGIRAHPIKFAVLLIVVVAAAIFGPQYWHYLNSYESTDDAQIDGNIYAITSRIAGTVKAVYVEDNQQVKAGQLLAELDPRDFEVAVAQARSALKESQTQVSVARPNVPITSVTTETSVSTSGADITAARAAVASAQRDYEAAVADIRNAEADNAKAQADRIDFLTHQAASPSSRTTMVISEKGFSMREDRPRARAENRFITRFLPT